MLKKTFPFLFGVLLVACSGLAPSGGPTGGGSLDAPAAPANAPTAAQPLSDRNGGSEETAYAYSQAPGFPAGNPGPDVTPENLKFHFYVFPKLTEYELTFPSGPIQASIKGVRVSGELQCPEPTPTTPQTCQEGLVLRIVDLKKMKFVETKIEAETDGSFGFQAEFPGSTQPEGPLQFEYWLFYLNNNPTYAPAALQSLQACPELEQVASACLPFSRGAPTWGIGMPDSGGPTP